MRESTYYTPELREIHAGFILQVLREGANYEKHWETCEVINYPIEPIAAIMGDKIHISDLSTRRDLERVRVKKLDREDIESCGWKFDCNLDDGFIQFKKPSTALMGVPIHFYILTVSFTDDDKRVFISDGEEGETIFRGMVLNKSELQFQMSRLG